MSVRFNRRGLAVEARRRRPSRPVRIGERDVGEVWLEREEGPVLLDELIVERLALAAGVLWRASPRPGRSTAHLIELVLSAGRDRGRAMGLLGLSPSIRSTSRPCHHRPESLAAGLAAVHRAILTWHGASAGGRLLGLFGTIGAVLAQPGLTANEGTVAASPGCRPGSSREWLAAGRPSWPTRGSKPRLQCGSAGSRAWGRRRLRRPGIAHDSRGGPPERDRVQPGRPGSRGADTTTRGRAALDTLQQRLSSGSVRETAAALYLHHSSVRYRLRKAEESLGLQLDDPRSRLRAELALLLWRLSSAYRALAEALQFPAHGG